MGWKASFGESPESVTLEHLEILFVFCYRTCMTRSGYRFFLFVYFLVFIDKFYQNYVTIEPSGLWYETSNDTK